MSDVQVDLVLDPVCPWCWLGHRYWQAAQDLVPEIPVETVLRPFQLDASIPKAGLPYQDYMKKRFGGDPSGRFKAMREHLEAAGPAAGIVFNFDEITMRPNTMDAHRLIRWAQGQGKGAEAAEALFKAYFEERRDIGAASELTAIAEAIGLDANLVADLLSTHRDKDVLEREEKFYRSLGVAGVPCFIFNGAFAVSGAEAPDVLADAIRKAASLPPEEDA
ncbi:DsbA family oxidoreductase [Glycocaulis sp.]|uniref:DsbA family oxidoreductase n=1 Tax=Glycocaulis sp. TaxID=1969725 RepID=UPI003D22952E